MASTGIHHLRMANIKDINTIQYAENKTQSEIEYITPALFINFILMWCSRWCRATCQHIWSHTISRPITVCILQEQSLGVLSRRFIDLLTEICHVTMTLLALPGNRGALDPVSDNIYGVGLRGRPWQALPWPCHRAIGLRVSVTIACSVLAFGLCELCRRRT